MSLRPDLTVRQVFRTPAPVLVTSPMPAVLVGIQREFAYRQDTGTYLGGQANSYDFPNLTTGSAVEPLTQADEYLQPKVYISSEYGVADVTADTTFSNLDQSVVAPSFVIATDAEAVFEVDSGTTGSYSSTTGAFTDPSADFIEGRVGAGDVIKLSGVPAFTVTALVSDDEVTVTRINHGPTDARVQISAKDSQGARTLTYEGTLGAGYDGFVTEGVKVGDAVSFDGHNERTATGGLTYTATASDERTLTATGKFGSVLIGDIVYIRDDENELEPAFHVKTVGGANSATAANIRGTLADSAVAGASGYPVKYFEIHHPTTRKIVATSSATSSTTGFFSAQDTNGKRTFSDVNGDFDGTPLILGDVVMVYAADSGSLSNIDVNAGNLTRLTGSWLTDGFTAGMTVLITESSIGAANEVERVISLVTDLVMTFTTNGLTLTDPDTVRVVSADVLPLFTVVSVESASSMTVTDFARGVLPAAGVGGPLKYSAYSMVKVAEASGADVSIEGTIQTAEKRFVTWPVAFDANTLPVAGETLFNDDGVLLFEVVEAARTTPGGGMTFTYANAGTSTLTRVGASLSWITAGFAAGDYIQIINSLTALNDGVWKIASITGVSSEILTFEDNASGLGVPPYLAGSTITAQAAQAVGTVQKLVVKNHTSPGFDVPAADLIDGAFLSVRNVDSAAYEVIRVNSETSIVVRHEVSGDEVDDTVVAGLITTITVPDTVTEEAYTVEKTLTGSSLSGDVLVTYAARRTDATTELREVTTGTAEEIAGPAVPGNPLGLAAALATPATGVPVYVLQISADTTEGWNDAREALETDQVYGVAPLTQDETQLVAFQSHVTTMSQPENKSERVLWQSHRFSSIVTRYTMDIADDSAVIKYPSTVQTIEVDHASGIVALGVIVGDVVTATYSGYFPSEGYITGSMTARIASISETGPLTTLTLVADSTVPATLSTGVSLTELVITSREYTTAALKTAVAAYPSTVQNRRVRNVYPDGVLITFDDATNPDDPTVGVYGGGEVTDYAVGGWIMAAIAAAQRSGLPASTPLTNRTFSGIQRLVTPFKSISAIDAIIDGGNYVMQQPGGENSGVSTYRAISTDVTDLNYLEEAVTIQIDSFVRKLRRQIKPLLGSTILDEAFFDMFSVQQQAVIYDTVEVKKELRSAKLLEVMESPTRADTFMASYQVGPYFSAANGDITVYI